jgi:betaine reductase
MITAMTTFAENVGASRTVAGTRIQHPCGHPSLSPEQDLALRRRIVETALEALTRPVEGPTVFRPERLVV